MREFHSIQVQSSRHHSRNRWPRNGEAVEPAAYTRNRYSTIGICLCRIFLSGGTSLCQRMNNGEIDAIP